ncbi:RING-box protein 2 [Nymphon striatum]|nr:RING-box protein 2 [Nymphon striatum]
MKDGNSSEVKSERMFALKKWNAVAMWRWDVECDVCAICRVQVMEFKERVSFSDACLRCQCESKPEDCVVVWGDCNHSFHNCCMALWVQQNNRCPLCQQEWVVQHTDENGVLTKEDFTKAAMKYAIIHCKGDKIDSVWDGYQKNYSEIWTALKAQADENEDEMVEFNEWKCLMEKLSETSKSFEDLPSYLQELALRLFSSFDINNDLGIDEAEYRLFLGTRNMELKCAKDCFKHMAGVQCGSKKKILYPLDRMITEVPPTLRRFISSTC